MRSGMTYKFGDVILVEVPFTNYSQVKLRPSFVLFEELGNIVIAGITSNPSMQGVSISKEEGLIVDSIVKLNYIFTVSKEKVKKLVTHISDEKKNEIRMDLKRKLNIDTK